MTSPSTEWLSLRGSEFSFYSWVSVFSKNKAESCEAKVSVLNVKSHIYWNNFDLILNMSVSDFS